MQTSRNKIAFLPALVLMALATVALCAADQPSATAASTAGSVEQGSGTQPSAADSEAAGNAGETATRYHHAKKGPPKAGQFVVAPIPFINPTLENGLALGAGYLFRPEKEDKVSPLSAVGAAYFQTSNSSNGYGGGGKLYLKEDRYRILALYAHASLNYDLYVLGRPLPIEQTASGYGVELLTRVAPKTYAGLRYIWGDVTTALDRDPGPLGIPPQDLDTTVRAPCVRVQWDSRNNPYYPTRGQFLDVQCNFASSKTGSRIEYERDYQAYWIAYNNYRSLSKREVLASRAYVQLTGGDAPFYALALYGQNSDLRGYAVGHYIGRTMWDAQVEYRRKFTKKLGAVAFAGVGGLADVPSYSSTASFLPNVGVGLRYTLDEVSGLNYRIDYAFGSGEGALYFAVGEAY